jgi:GTP-binding protein HflX
VLNKVDLIDKNEINYKIEILEEFFENEPIYVSATEKYNLDLLLDRISQSLKF